MAPKNGATPFLKSGNFLRTWSECEARPCELDGVALSLDRPPPPLPSSAPAVVAGPAVTTAAVTKVKNDPWVNLFSAAIDGASAVQSAVHALQNPSPSPPPKAPAAAAAKAPPEPPPVPPFDLQDIPGAMRQLSMPMSATLMDRWFNGQLNYSTTDEDEKDEIDQNGAPYPASMIDMTSITMKWVLDFTRAKNDFDTLTESRMLENPAALDELARKLSPYKHRTALHPWRECQGDRRRLHKEFQFQFIGVNASWPERIAIQMMEEVSNRGVPDDLTGALGAFNFYAAIAEATFNQQRGTATVTRVAIYVKDRYTFVTKAGSAPQYLGHWNKSQVAIQHRYAAAAGLNMQLSHSPVQIGKDVFYPVGNADFRAWQQQHGRGGDFVIYSDILWVTLNHPFTVRL